MRSNQKKKKVPRGDISNLWLMIKQKIKMHYTLLP